jgi:hypothetical protein
MSTIYDARTPVLLPALNALLTGHYLPNVTHPSEVTTSLLIALYESLVRSRLASIDRKDKSAASQIRNIKLLLGAMVMAGWDVGLVDPVGVVEREESCLMDLIQVLVEVGSEQYGFLTMDDTEKLPVSPIRRAELSTILERDSIDSDDSHRSTLRPLHQRAEDVLSRVHALNPNLRAPSPMSTTISRGTQTSPRPDVMTPRKRTGKLKTPKRTPWYERRKYDKQVQTDDDTESGIPSSIPLSYSSGSSPSDYSPLPSIHKRTPARNTNTRLSHTIPLSPIPPKPKSRSYLSDSGNFRIDSPYTAALRRRRQIALESLRKTNKSSITSQRRRRIRVFNVGKDVADSTFAEDSDVSTPRREQVHKRPTRSKLVTDPESTTDALTDLERRVKALRVWGGIEEERKEWLINEIKKKNDTLYFNSIGSGSGMSYSRRFAHDSGEEGFVSGNL